MPRPSGSAPRSAQTCTPPRRGRARRSRSRRLPGRCGPDGGRPSACACFHACPPGPYVGRRRGRLERCAPRLLSWTRRRVRAPPDRITVSVYDVGTNNHSRARRRGTSAGRDPQRLRPPTETSQRRAAGPAAVGHDGIQRPSDHAGTAEAVSGGAKRLRASAWSHASAAIRSTGPRARAARSRDRCATSPGP